MARNNTSCRPSKAVQLCIWTIRHQTWLAGQVRIYIYAATALVALLALADVITIQTAMLSAFWGGIVILGLIWTLVQHRKSMLLNIQEPEIREQVHRAMLSYLRQVHPGLGASDHRDGPQKGTEGNCRGCNLT